MANETLTFRPSKKNENLLSDFKECRFYPPSWDVDGMEGTKQEAEAVIADNPNIFEGCHIVTDWQ